MDRLAEVVAKAPVDIGDTIVADVLRTGSNIVATNTIEKVS
jgi:CxxC motif-containing protein